jgi:hypothetical protein
MRRRVEDAADRVLASGRLEVIDGYVVISDTKLVEIIVAFGVPALDEAMSAGRLCRGSDGRWVFLFREPAA